MTLRGWVSKRSSGAARWLETEGFEGQRREAGRPARRARGRRAVRPPPRAGARALVVALKPGNAGGAKGCRKVETRCSNAVEQHRRHSGRRCLRVNPSERSKAAGPRSNQRFGWRGCWPLSTRGSKQANQGQLCRAWVLPLAAQPMPGRSVPSWVRPPTGEPDAGDPHVRFGRRGGRNQSALPTPITSLPCASKVVDARAKHGHDERE